MAPRGVVTSPHSLASAAGVEMLKAGGSAVDAAIATSAALAVLYPHMTSVGGDAFWLIYDARAGTVRYLGGGGRAAASATIEAFARRGLSEIPYRGVVPATLTVPGGVASWCEAHAAYGRLPLARSLEAAIGYARDGFPVTARLARWIRSDGRRGRRARRRSKRDLHAGRHAAAHRREARQSRLGAHARGDRRRRPRRASMAARPRASWRATRAKTAVSSTKPTFARRTPRGTCRSLRAYRGVKIYETPAPTQGFTVLEMLNLLEAYEVARWPFLGPDHVHLLVQAKQIAYHDRDRRLADPEFRAGADRTADLARVRRRTPQTDRPARARSPWDRVPSDGSLQGDTVFIAIVDADGNAVSLIQSLYGIFGAGVVARRTGVVLQNRSAYFTLDPRHPNRLEPRKRPLHTLIASLAFRDDKLWQVLGCMGADGQPQIHVQTYVATIDFGLDIQQAVEMPRWLSGRFSLREPRDLLNIEARFPAATLAELERRGHVLNRWGDWNELAGHAHGIAVDPGSGLRSGGCDPRSDGAAIGY